MRKDKIVWGLLTLLIFFAVTGLVQAQNPSFVIGGWVFDHEGNPVSGVTIEITHLETGNSIPGIEPTDDLGRWIDNLGNLPLGDVPAAGDMIQIVATAPDGRTNTTVVPRAAEDPQIVNITLPPLAAPPTVTVRYPNGGESIERGTPVNVNAHATDDAQVVSVTFYYSPDNGTTWTSIGSGTLVDGSTTDGIWNATWDTTLLTPGSNYLIKATATDSDGLTANDASDATFTITVPAVTLKIGSYTIYLYAGCAAIVPIEILNATDIAGGSAKILFNSTIVNVKAVTSGHFGTSAVNIDNMNGSVYIAVARATAAGKEEAVMANIVFEPLSEGCSILNIQNASLNAENGDIIKPATINGSIKVDERMLGDLNRNNMMDTGDATLVLRMVVGLSEQDMLGDMNRNGMIDTGDATLILRRVVGLPV